MTSFSMSDIKRPRKHLGVKAPVEYKANKVSDWMMKKGVLGGENGVFQDVKCS